MLQEIAGFLRIDPSAVASDALLWLAPTLVVAALLGEAVRRGLGLPRIVGYSLVGALVALAGLGPSDGHLDGRFRLIVDVAVGLLLFELGSRVRLHWLRANPSLLWTALAEAVLGGAALVACLRALGFDAGAALAGAAVLLASSAVVIGRVSTELRSAGQVTERMLLFAAVNTVCAVLLHKLMIGWLYVERADAWAQAIVLPLYALAGSAVLALLLARVVAWVARRLDLRDENAVLLLLGLLLTALTAARALNLSSLLVPLLAGIVLRNTTDRPWVWPRHFGTAGGVLVLMLFVIVGSAWSADALVQGAALAAAALAARWAAKALVAVATARWTGIEFRQGAALALTLVPLSATSLVLFSDLRAAQPDVATQIAPLVLAAIALTELLGPLSVQWGLRLAGEHDPSAARDRGAAS
ncbi:MAG TPA: cation:proton antiporter [Quisquiliibacterium sp.]|nr:cation:proton antiporter [Quisquiliibacterium sp.]